LIAEQELVMPFYVLYTSMVYALISFFIFHSGLHFSGGKAIHDFHISRCEVNYETASGDLQVSAHIFIDDLESALAVDGKKGLHLCTSKESVDADDAIQGYLGQKLTFKSGSRSIKLELLGKETSKDMIAVWCYLEATGLKNLTALEIQNTILHELYNDQKNIVDFTINKKKKYFTIFDSKKVKEVYTL